MEDHRDAQQPRGHRHRYRHKAPLAENHRGPDPPQVAVGVGHSLEHPQGVTQVFQIEIAAELARADGVIGQLSTDQLPLDPPMGTDIMDFPALGPQMVNQGQVGGDMTGGSPAGEHNSLHQQSSPGSRYLPTKVE